MSVTNVTVVNAQHHRQYFFSDQMVGQMDGVLRVGPDAFQQYRAHDDDLKTRRSDPLFCFRCYRLLDRDMMYSEKCYRLKFYMKLWHAKIKIFRFIQYLLERRSPLLTTDLLETCSEVVNPQIRSLAFFARDEDNIVLCVSVS